MKKYSEIGGIPSKLKTPSELFEKVGKKWKCKVPYQADTFITRKRPFDVWYTTYDIEKKKKKIGHIGTFKDLSEEDRKKVFNAFRYKGKKEGKKINKLYLVDYNYEEQLRDDLELKRWAGNDKLRQQYYHASRYMDFKRMSEILAKLEARDKGKK